MATQLEPPYEPCPPRPWTGKPPEFSDGSSSSNQPPVFGPPMYIINALYQRPDIRAAVAKLAPQLATELAANPAAVQSINAVSGQELLSSDLGDIETRNPLAIAVGVAAAGYAIGLAMGWASRPK